MKVQVHNLVTLSLHIILLTFVFCTFQILEDLITLDKSQALRRQHLLSVLGIDFLKVQNIVVSLQYSLPSCFVTYPEKIIVAILSFTNSCLQRPWIGLPLSICLGLSLLLKGGRLGLIVFQVHHILDYLRICNFTLFNSSLTHSSRTLCC